ncbi:MAG: hypothetical protein ACRDN0_06720 [Trebonia sp.]
MAIVALVLWTITVAFGVYLLITSTRVTGSPDDARDSVPAGATVGAPAVRPAAVQPAAVQPAAVRPAARPKDRFDPPSLREAKDEPMPGLRALAEFTHPALAVTGFGFWVAYTLVRNDIFGVIAFGIMLGAIAAGISWAFSNARAAKRNDPDALSFSPRVLILHVTGAALTLLIAALITARV